MSLQETKSREASQRSSGSGHRQQRGQSPPGPTTPSLRRDPRPGSEAGPSDPGMAPISMSRRGASGNGLTPQQELSPRSHARQVHPPPPPPPFHPPPPGPCNTHAQGAGSSDPGMALILIIPKATSRNGLTPQQSLSPRSRACQMHPHTPLPTPFPPPPPPHSQVMQHTPRGQAPLSPAWPHLDHPQGN